MLFLQDAPADTTVYYIAGYAIIFGVMALYIISIYLRSRNLSQELAILTELDENSKELN